MPAEWMTYAELGRRLGISPAAARQLSRRRKWERRTPNAYGQPAQILVPEDTLNSVPEGNVGGGRTANGEEYDVQASLETAFTLLARQLEREQGRADRAERQLEADRERIEQLTTELADARAAERISAMQQQRCGRRSICRGPVPGGGGGSDEGGRPRLAIEIAKASFLADKRAHRLALSPAGSAHRTI